MLELTDEQGRKSNQRPTLTIVTVVLNDAKGLETTLNSIAEQTFQDFEHIVIDGGSIDGTVDLVRACQRIDYWSSAPDNGIYDAMNKGLHLASGQWVNFMNAGDSYLSPSSLSSVDLSLRDAIAILCPTLLRWTNGDEFVIEVDAHWRERPGLPTSHQSILYRTDVLREHPFDLRYRRAADYHQWLRLVAAGKVEISNVPLARFCDGGFSTRGTRGRLGTLSEYFLADKEIIGRRHSKLAVYRNVLKVYFREFAKAVLPNGVITWHRKNKFGRSSR